jgi:hypothetical protein
MYVNSRLDVSRHVIATWRGLFLLAGEELEK